jgi:hypothetical protein
VHASRGKSGLPLKWMDHTSTLLKIHSDFP